MKKIRTIRQAASEYKAADQSTPITEGLLRRMITAGALPYAKTGNKFLLDMETLEQVLSGAYQPVSSAAKSVPSSGSFILNKVRKIGG